MPVNQLSKTMIKYGLVSAGVAAASYFLDRQQGQRRRNMFRDQLHKQKKLIKYEALKTYKDIEHRSEGSFHELKGRLTERDHSDQTIHERVRAVLGHYTSNPGAIEVEVFERHVTLRGDILKPELKRLVWAVRTVRGVKSVRNDLIPHAKSENLPNLQSSKKVNVKPTIARDYWPPSYRAGFAGGGIALGLYGLLRKDIMGALMTSGGALLCIRAAANKSFTRMLGKEREPKIIHVQKSITVNAEIDKVFDVWLHPENFPTFMRNVHRVEKLSDHRYRWLLRGPLGTEIEWTTETTANFDNHTIFWQNLPGSLIEHIGRVHLTKHDDKTRVQVDMAYHPPAGALGGMIAQLFHVDPKTDLDEDMIRLKSMIETGKKPHDAFIKTAS